jgi:hypothetical protein
MTARRAVACCVVAVAALAGSAGCDDKQDAVPGRQAPERGSVYVALGGDDVFGGRSGLVNGWPQVLFRSALPITSTFVNLADQREGVADIRRRQVEPARALRPDLVTITVVDDAERGTDPTSVEGDLEAVVARLRSGAATRVLVGTLPPDAAAPEVVEQLNAAVTRAATSAGATIVDLSGVRSTDPATRGTAIAAAFADAL